MSRLSAFLLGPWRAVLVLGVTQILAWGILFYPPVLMMPLIAADRGWSLSFAMAGFSLALLVAGSTAPTIGGWIDRYGGHIVMAAGSLIGALAVALLAFASHPAAYLAVWVILGVAIAANLYDPAFATLGRIFGTGARKPITYLTLAGGFASTASWPATQLSLTFTDWRGTYLIFAAVLAMVAAPLHAFALPRTKAAPPAMADNAAANPPTYLPASGLVFFLVAAAFASYAFIPSGLAAHLIAMFGRSGIDPATAVMIGALFGPSQVAARICELVFGGRAHPLNLARFSVALILSGFALIALFGFRLWAAIAFAIMFGAANGLLTIARGAVPLALFGASGYGRVLGRIAKPFQVMQAMAPLALAFVVEHSGDATALAVTAAFGVVSLVCLIAIRRPKA
ncbi:MFS transporter [Pseudorhodoplanes sp.]|uniref:MFS transporter n=1 Tax=Pseudorhodoplanes sp. TaxID=1934341 RepID=UPI002C796392|nr:MFS transporter [Pseudorhodoplanes sp.]HWV54932.1 MFS transporter [Pseudorhodoplanes sp.]